MLYDFFMNNFLKVQLNRACYVSLLKNNEIFKGIEEYRKYIKKLNFLSLNPFLLKKCIDEKKKAKEVFVKKLEESAKKYFETEKYEIAQNVYKTIFEVDSKNYENIRNYISCLNKLEQHDISVKLAQYLVKKTKKANDYKILADVLSAYGMHKESIETYQKIFDIKGVYEIDDYIALACNYYALYQKTYNLKALNFSYKYFKKAYDLRPNDKTNIRNLIAALEKLKRHKEECEYWRKYIELGYATKEDEFSYSASCLLSRDFENWEKYNEVRYEIPNKSSTYLSTIKPRYDGTQDISDKTLLVLFEQGYGDTILMFGYLERLSKIAKKVIFYAPEVLDELLKNSNNFSSNVQILSPKDIYHDRIEHDYFMLSMSIPYALKLNKKNISVNGEYIKVDKKLAQEYKEKYFNTNKIKIGIAIKGHPDGPKGRDIPMEQLALLDKLKNAQFYCFTKDVEDEDLKKVFKRNKIINIAKKFPDFNHTAAALENVDILVSSDNGILNLAGAMGKKTLGIFNYHYEFRWYDLSGEDCGWYKCVKPFVNESCNNWKSTMIKVVKEIEVINKAGN